MGGQTPYERLRQKTKAPTVKRQRQLHTPFPTESVAGSLGAGMAFKRITINPDQMGGVPCIRGLRIPVATVVDMVGEGIGEDEILAACPDLKRDDIREALHYAAEAVRERELPLAAP
jgi:uncharacterized protein (DUF433 family)